ncbi:hypothetical protein Clacol_008604 [Clathrus columnatus]|uniref:Uncharacterized protein n=1 Tax=Clathrus columnatus TaxID=1419009 RepID=A0AAV5AJ03_9AGAM|nr:hypothetical protein Clacol_008604 [Clathrus columnatus]
MSNNITVLPPPEQAALDALITAGNHLRIEDDEVELIWRTRVTPLAEIMLILRVYAVHKKNKIVLGIMLTIWVIQLCLMSFTLAHSGPVIIPPSPVTYGCILVADPSIGALDSFFVVPSIIFDTVTITLLLMGLYLRTELKTASALFQVLLRDGVLYFAVVVLTNTAWTATGLSLSFQYRRQRNETEVWGERENHQYPLLPSQFSQRKLTTTQGSATLVDPDHPTVSPLYIIPGSSAAEFHRVLPKADRHIITPYQLVPNTSSSLERLPKSNP